MKNVIVRGSQFNASTFSRKLKGYRGSVADFSLLLEGASKQATFHANMDWLNRMFEIHDNNDLLKSNGDLSVKGKAARAYVVFHAPAIKIEKQGAGKHAGQWRASFTKSDKYRGSVATGVDSEGVKIMASDPAADFAFDFKAWQDRAKKPNKAKNTKAATLVNQIEKMLEAFDVDSAAPIDTDIEALRALEVKARRLMDTANARLAGIIAEQAQHVDADQAKALANVKPQSSKRAGQAATS